MRVGMVAGCDITPRRYGPPGTPASAKVGTFGSWMAVRGGSKKDDYVLGSLARFGRRIGHWTM